MNNNVVVERGNFKILFPRHFMMNEDGQWVIITLEVL